MAETAQVIVIGGGLAGCECAWQLAERGIRVELHEQKPQQRTAAQTGDHLAELVCSNSFRSDNPLNTIGLLHEDLRLAGSLILRLADENRVPAGDALAVDRDKFSEAVEAAMRQHPNIALVAGEVTELPVRSVWRFLTRSRRSSRTRALTTTRCLPRPAGARARRTTT